jgi:hypothetical protein
VQEEHADAQGGRGDDRHGEHGRPPQARAAEAEIDQIGDEDTDRDHQLEQKHQLAADGWGR